MSDLNDALTDLTDVQEETVSGGGGGLFARSPMLLFQNTEIDTFGENQTTIQNPDGISASSISRTGYQMRQTTLAFFGGAEQFASLFKFLSLFQRFF